MPAVAKKEEIPPGQAKAVEVNGKRIAIFNVDGTFYAIDDTCTHRGGPLSEGDVEKSRLEVTAPGMGRSTIFVPARPVMRVLICAGRRKRPT